ncbi:unnamed protein product [Aspergillus oryzae var. brunneus]|uniref:Unnamed protein product n=1 Tax=Aspergillus oryzae var. brunneus TaxID=332754 RepID=A0ABQ6KDB1_ASPOZ|nr:unnamed protein product [Aspergillus oryzae]GMG42829.1 unnamed protein product [Aspergillus oryzae var. brunneus]
MYTFPLLLGILAATKDLALAKPTQKWGLREFNNLVTFGDSYTDDTRASYFYAHNGSAPPVGWKQPEVHTKPQRLEAQFNP